MRAFFHPAQSAHDPQQYMRFGRVVAPKDVPARTEALLAALRAQGITVEMPTRDFPEAREAVHTKGFLGFLATAWERWQRLPDHGRRCGQTHFHTGADVRRSRRGQTARRKA